METKHQSRNFFLALIVCLSLLVVAGSPAGANEWSYPEDPGFVATSPEELRCRESQLGNAGIWLLFRL